MKIPQFLLILWLLMVHTLTHGQSTKSRLQHLTIEDGLPQNMVDCLLQDSHGFIWIGTWNGLCRYNGYDFEILILQLVDLMIPSFMPWKKIIMVIFGLEIELV